MTRSVHEVFASLTHGQAAGAAVRIERLSTGEVLFEATSGLRRMGGQPMGPDDRYHLASIGKTFTAVLLLQLAEEGRLGPQGVDTRLADTGALPAEVMERLLRVDGQPCGHEITLRHLLQHTGGLRDAMVDDSQTLGGPAPRSLVGALLGQQLSAAHRWTPWTPALVDVPQAGVLNWYLHEVAEHGLGRPGQRFHYSDTGYVLIGLVIEAVSGWPLQVVLERRIAAPLGLSQTYLAYVGDPAGMQADRHPESEPWMGPIPCLTAGVSLSFDWAGGGIVSTAAEQARFLRAVLQGELFQGRSTSEAMSNWAQPEGLRSPRLGVGLGLFHTRHQGLEFVGHSGAWGCKLFAAPAADLLIAGTFNRSDAPEDWHAQLAAALI